MSYQDDDDPFEEDIVFDQAGLLSMSRKPSKSAIKRVSSGKCATLSKTLGLCGAFLGLGLTVAIPGPLSPVPPSELSHDISLMTYEVMYRCQGFMIGAMFGARLLDRFNRLFLVFLALLVTALLVTIIPWCGIVWLLRTDMLLLGASFGFLTTGGNVLCLDLWGRNSGPFMQALHFSFSLGVFLSPFLSQPLIAPVNSPEPTPSTTPAMFPLHRLSRDVSNISAPSAYTSMIRHHQVYLQDMPLNESLKATSASAFNASSSHDLGEVLNHQLAVDQNASRKSVIQTPSANSSAQVTSAGSSTFQATASATSSVIPLDQVLAASTASTVLSHLPSDPAETTGASNVSTTTHRAPRPKPILTNSDKLKDKTWENEKFRKPPPQDLVPVSTTMKPMFKPDNKTTNGTFLSTASPSLIPQSNSTSRVTASASVVSKSNATLQTLKILASSNSSAFKLFPSNATVLKDLVEDFSITSSPSNSQNISSLPTSTAAPAMDKVTPVITVSGSPSDQRKISSLIASTSTSLKNVTKLQLNDTANHASKPNEGKMDMIANHEGGATVPSHTSASDNVKKSNIKVEEVTYKTEAVQSASLSSSQNDEGTKQHQLNLLLPQHEKSNSNNSFQSAGESVFSDKLPLPASNVSTTLSSIQGSGLQAKKFENQSLTSQRSKPATTKPPMDVKLSQTGEMSQMPRTSGTDNVKITPEENQLYSGLSDNVKASTEAYVSKSSAYDPNLLPQIEKNASILSKNLGNIGSPASPKHPHHSKPASTVVNDTEVTHTVIDAFANRLEKYGLSRMELMYLTVGMVLFATSLLFLGFLCFNPRDPKSKTDDEEINGPITRGNHQSRNNNSCQVSVITSRCLRHTLIGLMMLLLMITSGVQAMYGQLLLVYAIQSPVQISQATGTALTATFWGALTSTRFACILLASALSPTAMLILSVSICSCATWLLSAFSSSSEVALWIGSVMVSVGTASVFPSGMLWMQHHVLITHRVAAMLVMGPAMGEMFLPPLAYKMMVSLGPASLVHLPALLSLFAIALWAAVWRLARYPRPPHRSNIGDSSGYQLANQNDEDDFVDLTMSPILNGNGPVSSNLVRSNGINPRMPYITA